MKDKFGAISKVVVILLASVLVCYGVMFVFDKGFNGMVGEWFKESFIYCDSYYTETNFTYIESLNWHRLKSFITFFTVGLVIFWTATAIVFYVIGKHGITKKVVRSTAGLMRDYIILDEGTVKLPKGYQDISRFLSEIKMQNKENERRILEEVNKKNDLIAYLAHDLKTPLTSVIGYLSLLEEVPDMPTEQKAKYAHIALEKAMRLEFLINEFFDITRYNLHEIMLERENIDLGYMLNQLADEFYPMLQAHGNTIVVEAEETITVNADPDKLARVFNNLLKNAIAYSYANTHIEIKATATGKWISVAFTNSGKTIPKQKLDFVFDKFYRLDDARSSYTGGTGMGLAIAKDIVLQHGGSINVISTDGTTTFTVELPQKTIGKN